MFHLHHSLCLILAFIALSYTLYAGLNNDLLVNAVDIHAVENEQKILSSASNGAEPNHFEGLDFSNITDIEVNKTIEHISKMISDIQRLSGGNFSLSFDIEEAKKIISFNKDDSNDVIGVITLIEKASNKGSEVMKQKAEFMKQIIKERFSEEQIEEFVNKTTTLLTEWLNSIGITEQYLQSKLDFEDNHKLLRALHVGIAAVHALIANKNPASGVTFGLNHLSIFGGDELIGTYCGTLPIKSEKGPAEFLASEQKVSAKSYPTSWNLVDQGVIGPVLNQGSCGCCYAFSAIQAFEGLYASQNNKTLYDLSEQQIVDCDTVDNGCNGGTFQSAWNYIYNANGITTDSVYPYTSGNGKSGACQTSLASQAVLTSEKSYPFQSVRSDSQMQAAAYTQPVSIAIQASSACFKNYKSGVLTPQNCNCGTSVDHAVLLTGWGVTSDGTEYWIVKNSWGSGWGNKGYVWIARLPASTNYCGMYQQSAYPTSVALSSACTGSSPPSYCNAPDGGNSSDKLKANVVLVIVTIAAIIFGF